MRTIIGAVITALIGTVLLLGFVVGAFWIAVRIITDLPIGILPAGVFLTSLGGFGPLLWLDKRSGDERGFIEFEHDADPPFTGTRYWD